MQRLTERNSFLTWKMVKDKKAPFGLDGEMGIKALAGTFEDASKVAKRLDGIGGVGLVFDDSLPAVFIDIDDYDDRLLVQQNLLRVFSGKAYIERSSDNGFHIIAHVGNKDEYVVEKTEKYELYFEKRFCALTGKSYGHSLRLEDVFSVDCSDSFRKIYRALKLIIKTREIAAQLSRGVVDRYDSPSEFDYALSKISLAFTSDKDTIHGILMLSESDLCRKRHGGEINKTFREDYVFNTIKSIAKEWDHLLVSDTFDPVAWKKGVLVEIQEKVILRRQAFCVVRSTTGVGKGHFTLSILASLFGGDHSLGAVSKENSYSMLYIDTEMGKELTSKMRDMFLRKIGKDVGTSALFASVKDLKISERILAINRLAQDCQPTVIAIDGIRDLLHSPNNQDQTYSLIQELEHLTTVNNCALVCTIHVNPGQDNVKSRGHLGTEIEQKAFSVIHLGDNENDTITVTNIKNRLQKFEPYEVEFDNANGYLTLLNTPF